MNRDADFLLERVHQLPSRVRLANAGHVLDRQQMGTQLLELLGQIDIVFQAVLGSARIEDVAAVADGRFAEFVGVTDGVHGQAQIGQPVQGIEDAEKIDSGSGRFLHEGAHDIVRIIRIAYGIGGAEQHLKQDVRNPLAQRRQTVPRRLLEETHGRVKRRPAPHLQRE